MIDAFLENLPDSDNESEDTEEILERVRIFELNERSFEKTNTSIAPPQVYGHCASPAQSTSTTSTNALIAQEHSGRLAQSTSTSTTITNALITQLRVQDNCAGPSQSTSTSTNSTKSVIAQIQEEIQSQIEASVRYLCSFNFN